LTQAHGARNDALQLSAALPLAPVAATCWQEVAAQHEDAHIQLHFVVLCHSRACDAAVVAQVASRFVHFGSSPLSDYECHTLAEVACVTVVCF
jgi:hypothetical protein